MYVCMYACMHACMQLCLFACLYNVCMHVCLFVCLFVYMYVCMYVCLFVCLFVHMYVCICDPTAVGTLPQLGTRNRPSSLKRSRQGEPPSPEELRKLPRKMRPCSRQGKHHHQHPVLTGSQLGTSQLPSPAMSTPVKHPQTFQRPQHPQPPRSATNHNSGRPNLLDQAELGRLYKPARSSISKESTTRSRRDNFSGSNLSFTGLQRSHRDYFSGSPSGQINKNMTLTDPYREAWTTVSKRSGHAQTPPRPALQDVHLDIGAALPEANATCRIPRADRPPMVLDIPGSTPEPSEPNRHTDSPSRGPRSPR